MTGMELELDGQTVIRVCFDYGISLQTDNGFEIRIEADYVARPLSDPVGDQPGRISQDPGAILAVRNQIISVATVADSGTLSLTFSNGTVLSVEPHEMYEAWTVTGPRGMKMVSMPGGELAVWSMDNF
jgi:uncharacterized protein DUF6188